MFHTVVKPWWRWVSGGLLVASGLLSLLLDLGPVAFGGLVVLFCGLWVLMFSIHRAKSSDVAVSNFQILVSLSAIALGGIGVSLGVAWSGTGPFGLSNSLTELRTGQEGQRSRLVIEVSGGAPDYSYTRDAEEFVVELPSVRSGEGAFGEAYQATGISVLSTERRLTGGTKIRVRVPESFGVLPSRQASPEVLIFDFEPAP